MAIWMVFFAKCLLKSIAYLSIKWHFQKKYLLFILERGREGEREGEKH